MWGFLNDHLREVRRGEPCGLGCGSIDSYLADKGYCPVGRRDETGWVAMDDVTVTNLLGCIY